jgi:predicted RecA/RadA family phage recombinase
MKNYRQPGEILTFTAPSGGVVSGGFYVIGTLVACACIDADEGDPFTGKITGVFEVTKAPSQAWTEGAAIYYDAGNTRFTTTAGGNTAAGNAVAAVGGGADETTGLILLNGLPGAAV